MSAAVEVDQLVVRHGDLVAVDGVSFRAAAGAVTALLGPNGAGKTSTIDVLEGYRRPDGGQVRVLGLDPVADHAALVRRMGVMLQEGGVGPGVRPPEALALFAALYPDPVDPDTLLERVGLAGRRRTTWRQLSGGERQRLSLALALVGRPDVVFLDEPTAGVDVAGRRIVHELVREQRAAGTAVVLTTHDLAEAEALADRIVIVDHGRVVADATPAELTSAPSAEIRFGSVADLDVAGLATTLGAPVDVVSPGEYRIGAPPDPARVAALTAWLATHDLPLADLRAGRQRLEDVFVRLTEEGDG
ncbi:MAG TPA: ABC transporter ATP-binding protein [Acidimicrobiales bacterium]|nr:ABC transporter ATP-binding protein [Acidimicrobiales bacterium]